MPVRTEHEPGVCCCVIVHVDSGTEAPCCGLTSGPDEPFCEICTERHRLDQRLTTGEIRVLARIRRKENSYER